MSLSLRCFIPSFVEIGPLIPGKTILKVFLPYIGMLAFLVHVTSTMSINFHFMVPKSLDT